MDEMRNAYSTLVGKSTGKGPLGRCWCSGRIILEWIVGKQGGKVWTGCIWLRTRISGGLLSTRQWTFGIH